MSAPLSQAKKKHFRSLGHKLQPVVTVSDRGPNEGVNKELERALEDHELIKVKVNVGDPGERRAVADALCEQHKAELVQAVGKVILIFRPAGKPKRRLSNLHRPL